MSPPPQPSPPPQRVIRKLIVDIVEARDLLPKDGQGTSSPYAIVEYDGQKKRTSTIDRDLHPIWNETLEFLVSDPSSMDSDDLEIELFTDRKGPPNPNPTTKRRQSLGRIKLYGIHFSLRGQESLLHLPLQKKSLFSWIRGSIFLRVYYYDDLVPLPDPTPPHTAEEAPAPPPPQDESSSPPPIIAEDPAPTTPAPTTPAPAPAPAPEISSPEIGKQNSKVKKFAGEDYSPKAISGRISGDGERMVEPVAYLFVRVVKARGLQPCELPIVKVRSSGQSLRSRPASYRPGSPDPEWGQVFALGHSGHDLAGGGSTLEVLVLESMMSAEMSSPTGERFLGGLCLDLSDVPVRDPPDSSLAPQWYRLDGGSGSGGVSSGEIQVAVWIGTQADDAFPESRSSDTAFAAYARSKVYQSPKLWYLRVSVLEAQDLQAAPVGSFTPMVISSPLDIRVKAHIGFQARRSRRGSVSGSQLSSVHWSEDFMFVVGEPLEDQRVTVTVEDHTGKYVLPRSGATANNLGEVVVPVDTIEQRLDDRIVRARWLVLEGEGGSHCGRLLLRAVLEAGYHVADEAAVVCSDYRPTAKQLWRPPIGVLELGILGARGLLPMKTKDGGRTSTDAYCVAKYGKKWVRTNTIVDSLDPRWNEQYTWQVFDPCTVLTVGVFDNWRMFSPGGEPTGVDHRIGKIRVRISTLESNKVYTTAYPLLVLLRGGLRKMGELELAVRFATVSAAAEALAVYGQPLFPAMHHLRPVGAVEQEALRAAAVRTVAAWLGRAEPPLGAEVVRFMLDADSGGWSMRRSRANWFRVVALLGWVAAVWRWVGEVRRWRSPATTVLVHVLYLVMVWYPDLVAPTVGLYLVVVVGWYYRFRAGVPAGMDARVSQAEGAEADELDEEMDGVPSGRTTEVVRARYDRLRVVAGRVQALLGDVATRGERLEALVRWRDPRATKVFMAAAVVVTVVLYCVPAKMVAVALGFYFLRHPMFRSVPPSPILNFFRRLPSLNDRLM